MRHRIRDGCPQFLIRWAGFPASFDTWEPRENVLDDRLLQRYFQKCPRAQRMLDPNPEYRPRVAALSLHSGNSAGTIVAVVLPPFSDPVVSRQTPTSSDSSLPVSHTENHPPTTVDAWDPISQPLARKPALIHKCSFGMVHSSSCPSSSPSVPPETIRPTRPSLSVPCSDLAAWPTRPRRMLCHVSTELRFLWVLIFWFFSCCAVVAQVDRSQREFDSAGRVVSFYPGAMMIAKYYKPLVLFRDTKLVSLHMGLPSLSRGSQPSFNSTCDPVLAKFYDQVLSSIRGVQRATARLLSVHGASDLLECDSYLRRFYGYVSGLSSGLDCPARHYASSLSDCKRWAVGACQVRSAHEKAWLKERCKRSSIFCHFGLGGIARWLYTSFGGDRNESPDFSGLLTVLQRSADAMDESHELTQVVNGKVTYLIKTIDLLNSKLNQVITSLRLMQRAFKDWQARYNKYISNEFCHFNLNQEFLSLYFLEVNKAFGALLRLTEIDDLVRQFAHLSRKTLVGFPDLPRFLTAQLELRLSRFHSLSATVSALRAGFALMIEPVVDFNVTNLCTVQIHLLFTLPNLHSTSICTLEQLSPISYQLNGLCFGGAISRHDLLLLSCEDKRYVVTQTELEQCFHADSTILCPDHVLSTVENPEWLGLKWHSGSHLSFKHTHIPLQRCHNLQPLIHLGGRYYLSTSHTNLTLSSPHNGSHVISLQPLGIYHFPRPFSFPFQRTGFGSCAPHITIYFPLFSEGTFQYVPWSTHLLENSSLFSPPTFHIPAPLSLDHSTLKSLNETYTTLDADLTRRLQAVYEKINTLPNSPHTQVHSALIYFTLALSVVNLVVIIVFYCVCMRRFSASVMVTRASSTAV